MPVTAHRILPPTLPARLWPLWIVSAVLVLVATALLLLALVMLMDFRGPWDVNGVVLRGGSAVLFALAVAGLGATALVCVLGLIRIRGWARPLAVGFWVLGHAMVLAMDRLSGGPHLPMLEYLGTRMLVPALLTAALLYGPRSVREHFRPSTRAHHAG